MIGKSEYNSFLPKQVNGIVRKRGRSSCTYFGLTSNFTNSVQKVNADQKIFDPAEPDQRLFSCKHTTKQVKR
jgi:hypothetical protein